MAEMDGMEVVGFGSSKKASGMTVDPQCKGILEQVDSGLKAHPENDMAMLGQPLKTKDEAKKKCKFINGQIGLIGGDFSRYKARFKGSDQAGYQVFCIIKNAAQAGKKGKVKNKAKGAKKEAKKPSHEQFIVEAKKMMETPEGRAKLETSAKLAGCNTPEEYIAKMEEKMKGGN